VYRGQFLIPEAHTDFIEETLEEYLKIIRVVRHQICCEMHCVRKKSLQGQHIVQDFRDLTDDCHIDKHSMKEINECICTTLGRTSEFWQMPLHADDPHTHLLSHHLFETNLNVSPRQAKAGQGKPRQAKARQGTPRLVKGSECTHAFACI
jgi:hypothetical protein